MPLLLECIMQLADNYAEGRVTDIDHTGEPGVRSASTRLELKNYIQNLLNDIQDDTAKEAEVAKPSKSSKAQPPVLITIRPDGRGFVDNTLALPSDHSINVPVTVLPDGSAVMLTSTPLPKDHWLYEGTENNLPKCVLTSEIVQDSEKLKYLIRTAGKYAIKTCTRNGQDMDFDPDAMLQALVLALLGQQNFCSLIADNKTSSPTVTCFVKPV